MNLRAANLNLLKTLQVLLHTRNVTIAASELFLTQPAVSNTLKQLRELFNDELFIKRRGALLELTPKAKEIKPKLDLWIKQTQALIADDELMQPFLPEKCTDKFHIALHNRVSTLIFPALYQQMKTVAPHIKIKHTDVTDLNELSAKELHQFDFIIGSFNDVPENYIRENFFSDHLICLSGIKSLNKKRKLSVQDLNDHEHIILSYMNDYTKTFVETLLVSQGVQRSYRMIVSDTLLALQLAYTESLLLILMKRRAEFLQKIFPLKIFDLPFESPELKTEILYKEIDSKDSVKMWFKSFIISTCHAKLNTPE